ncbi:hypothetical protein CRM94_25945 [Burkholderia gladioli]|uniref:Tat pathway signal sequence domain protein n=1 Tax=Burkholderia gladioli TaxID=28095 RepID=A0A2A7S9J9_BURGA|nr:hypothetical protein CEJ98_13220 [Burkholderia gladioli pv. gladioli]AWY56903.1 hypothetical protein A8H28_27905 [Burkholderia gladioli pv. gladioli]PEH40228.1 hypothetical protein CRM94_25945 [Burkholderia gladioli]
MTGDCVDPLLDKPYIDVKRPQTVTDLTTGLTVSYLYVHGGFSGTNVRFSFYFPAAEKYQRRFFETTYPTIVREDAALGCPEVGTSVCSVVFAISNGAYVVSTNNAGGPAAGGVLAAYRANAAAAKYSRVVAQQLYGSSARPRGYLYGASGGAYQTVGSMENTDGVWDGAVPMVFGVPNAIPSFMTAQLLALRVLADKLPQIADAMAPGGSGDPYVGLSAKQQSVLKEVTRLGHPLRGWWQYSTLNGGGFLAVQGVVRSMDPTYVEDFWTKDGYEGHEPSVQAARIQYDTVVTSVEGSTALVLANVLPAGALTMADLSITSGPKAGESVQIMRAAGNTVKLSANPGITPGTKVRLDNSWLIALQYYHRHQIGAPDEYGWDQYRSADGAPLYAQRPLLVGPLLAASSAGAVPNGHFYGKMIMVESTMDVSAYPWSADWYRHRAQAARGGAFADSYRLWFMDHADHGPDLSGYEAGVGFAGIPRAANHIVGYLSEVQQALLDLDEWVANGVQPPPNTEYHIDADNQVRLPATAAGRGGIQPVVILTAMTSAGSLPSRRVEAMAGRPVILAVKAQVPPTAGKIVKVEWDFEGKGSFTDNSPLPDGRTEINLEATYVFSKPGVYFPVVRVASQRDGETTTPFGLVQNIASVRIVVH